VLDAHHLAVEHGGAVVLDDITLSVVPGDRLGIVGPNGIGKSTLLRLLAGIDEPDGGRVERSPASLTVGFLRQEADICDDETLRAHLARRTGVADAAAALDAATAALGADEASIEAYGTALDAFLTLGGDDLDARVGVVLTQVGLPADRLDVPLGALSGGQVARASLAAILLSRHDVLLLDEPTNDLDLDGLATLESFVRATPAAVVVVSHDRAFLDACVHRMIEITEEHHRAVEYAGGWSDYVEARALGRRQQRDAHDAYAAEKDRLTDRVRTQRAWSEQGVRKAKTSSPDGDKIRRAASVERSEKQASKVRTSERRLARLTPVDKPWEGWQLDLELHAAERSGDVVARLTRAVVRRGSFTLGPVDLEVTWKDRVAIVGPNGSGKSTLLAAIRGEVPLDAGECWVGPGVKLGTLDQDRAMFDPSVALLDSFLAQTGMLRSDGRSLLAKFGLGADEVLRPVGSMSPGERTRAQLAALMAGGVNCLVLDEPTNHLDLPAIEQLEQALGAYDGTLLVVSHDRRFLDAVHLDRTIDLTV